MLATVVIPCLNRPAFLKICLEYIMKADQADEFQYLFALDHGFDPRCLSVINDFPLTKAISKRSYHILGDGKQSNNVLTGLFNAAAQKLPIFYVEDDVFVGKDFFTFGLEIMAKEPKVLCAILSKNVNGRETPPADLNGYYVKYSNEYQGIGSIFNPELFLKYVAPHSGHEYVLRTREYCKSHFPHSILGGDYSEQDGLIRRIIEANYLPVAFSCVPRCFHAGFFGYHRFFAQHIKNASIDKQVEMIKAVAFDVDQLRATVKKENLVQDSLPVDLGTEHAGCSKINL